MRELINDPFYEMIKAYDRCVVDYCLLESDAACGGYESHKEAVLFAMQSIPECSADDRLKGEKVDPQAFLYSPAGVKKFIGGIPRYDESELPDVTGGGRIPYWYAFLCPPHGTRYVPEDFRKVNEVLFPNGAQPLEVWEWTTDWSDYFDDGHEWWGAACWSVYDRSLNRFAVLFASSTD